MALQSQRDYPDLIKGLAISLGHWHKNLSKRAESQPRCHSAAPMALKWRKRPPAKEYQQLGKVKEETNPANTLILSQ